MLIKKHSLKRLNLHLKHSNLYTDECFVWEDASKTTYLSKTLRFPVCLAKGRKKVSPDKMMEMQAKIEEERKALEAKLDMEEEERNKARAELEKREKDLLKAQ